MKFTIKTRNAKLLRKASRKSVEDYFVGLPAGSRSTKWLNKNNRYRLGCTSRYEKDIGRVHSTLNTSDLIGYVSASAAAHIIDGWSYLGRAVEATLRGDNYSAIHLGYYAELRAAMGLLAAEGIGIFNTWHTIIDSTGVIEPFPLNRKINPRKRDKAGTHRVIWPILHHWSGLQRAADLLNELVSPNSIALSDWLTAVGATLPIRAVARHWLTTWGLDLATVDDDHDLRNLASYRPSEFRRATPSSVHESTEFVEHLWRLFEPSSAPRFPNLERLLVRSAWRRSGATTVATNDLELLGLSGAEASEWAAFLVATNDPLPLRLASVRSSIEDARSHLSVVSRASLLLFVATSTARRLLVNAGYTAEDIAFWWQPQGQERGLWLSGAAPGDPLDLWADILVSITESETWRANNHAAVSIRSWREAQTAALNNFGSFELVGIWGLVP